jgi:hypothetical protein
VSELSEDEIKVLQSIIRDRLWWEEATRRAKRVSIIAGGILGALALLGTWWPWITHVVQFFIKDVPTT